MNKAWGVILMLPLSSCSSGGEDKAVQACETVFAALNGSRPVEQQGKSKITKKELQKDKVHLLVNGPNGRGEMIYEDINCVFKLDREPTEKDATLKLSQIEIGKFPDSLWSFDHQLKTMGFKTITESLEEKGLNAILPSETRLTSKQ